MFLLCFAKFLKRFAERGIVWRKREVMALYNVLETSAFVALLQNYCDFVRKGQMQGQGTSSDVRGQDIGYGGSESEHKTYEQKPLLCFSLREICTHYHGRSILGQMIHQVCSFV